MLGFKRQRMRGFTLVEMMIVVLIIAMLLAIAIPNFLHARTSSRRNSCIANLRTVESAKDEWAMDTMAANGDTVLWSNLTGANGYLKGPSSGPTCPAGGTYTLGKIGTNATCSKSAMPDLHVLQ